MLWDTRSCIVIQREARFVRSKKKLKHKNRIYVRFLTLLLGLILMYMLCFIQHSFCVLDYFNIPFDAFGCAFEYTSLRRLFIICVYTCVEDRYE